MGVGPQKCMQVRDNPESKWEFFYDGIEGFDFQEGIPVQKAQHTTQGCQNVRSD